MKQTNVFEGIGVALLMALLWIPLFGCLKIFLWGNAAACIALSVLFALYCMYLLSKRKGRIGTLTLATLSLGTLCLGVILGISILEVILLGTGMIWLLRSVVRYRSLICSGMDALLCILSLGFAVWMCISSGSMVLAIWGCFLINSLFVFIPVNITKSKQDLGACTLAPKAGTRFEKAYSSAESALGNLIRESLDPL